jgi:hypothetical protein
VEKNKRNSEFGPRIFWPRRKKENQKELNLQKTWIRLEFIIGGGMLAVGGFIMRERNSYDLIVLGFVLISLATSHFYRIYNRSSTGPRISENDRILTHMRRQLNTDYSIAVDYPLNESNRIDYLLVGPPGLYVVKRMKIKGRLEGDVDSEKWLVEDGGKKREISNPLLKTGQTAEILEKKLQKNETELSSVVVRDAVVFAFHAVEGNPLRSDRVFALDGIVPYLLGQEKRFDWEVINEIEKALDFHSYLEG